MRFRFSLAGLMTGVAFCAISIAALRNASALWASLVFTFTVATLVAAMLACALQSGKRATWGSFALVGWCYMALVFGPWCNVHIRPRLITTHIAEYLQPSVQDLVRAMVDTDHAAQMKQAFESITTKNGIGPPWSSFEQIAQCVFAWVLAVAAAKLCSRWEARNPAAQPAVDSPAGTSLSPAAESPQFD